MGKKPALDLYAGLLAILLVGCATRQQPSAKVEILQPGETKHRSVIVLSDAYMQDFDLADHLRESMRQECIRQGFDVKPTEYDADLVIVPGIAVGTDSTSGMASTSASRLVLRKSRLFDSAHPPMSAGMLGETASAQPSRLALVVSAYRREDWLDPQFINAPMPKVWRIVVSTPQRDGKEAEQALEMVAACGKALDTLAPSAGNTH